MSPARAISSRPPAAGADARSQATFASPYWSTLATSASVAGSNSADSSSPMTVWDA
jgi:hypothetical protein